MARNNNPRTSAAAGGRKRASKPPEDQVVVTIARLDDQGGFRVSKVEPKGDVRIGEVPTVLEMGVNHFRNSIGLNNTN